MHIINHKIYNLNKNVNMLNSNYKCLKKSINYAFDGIFYNVRVHTCYFTNLYKIKVEV